MEEAGRTFRDMARIINVQLEVTLKMEITPSMGIMQWLVGWAAMLLSKYRMDEDSKTPYERQKGKVCDLD